MVFELTGNYIRDENINANNNISSSVGIKLHLAREYESSHGQGSVFEFIKSCEGKSKETNTFSESKLNEIFIGEDKNDPKWKKNGVLLIATMKSEITESAIGYVYATDGKGDLPDASKYTDWINISAIAVKKNHRRQGIGKFLLSVILRGGKEQKKKYCSANLSQSSKHNEDATRKLFERLRFAKESKAKSSPLYLGNSFLGTIQQTSSLGLMYKKLESMIPITTQNSISNEKKNNNNDLRKLEQEKNKVQIDLTEAEEKNDEPIDIIEIERNENELKQLKEKLAKKLAELEKAKADTLEIEKKVDLKRKSKEQSTKSSESKKQKRITENEKEEFLSVVSSIPPAIPFLTKEKENERKIEKEKEEFMEIVNSVPPSISLLENQIENEEEKTESLRKEIEKVLVPSIRTEIIETPTAMVEESQPILQLSPKVSIQPPIILHKSAVSLPENEEDLIEKIIEDQDELIKEKEKLLKSFTTEEMLSIKKVLDKKIVDSKGIPHSWSNFSCEICGETIETKTIKKKLSKNKLSKNKEAKSKRLNIGELFKNIQFENGPNEYLLKTDDTPWGELAHELAVCSSCSKEIMVGDYGIKSSFAEEFKGKPGITMAGRNTNNPDILSYNPEVILIAQNQKPKSKAKRGLFKIFESEGMIRYVDNFLIDPETKKINSVGKRKQEVLKLKERYVPFWD